MSLLRRPVTDAPVRPRPRRLRAAVALVPVLALGAGVLSAAPVQAKKKDVRPIVSGWLPYWTTSASIASMQANKDLLQEVSPFWYSLTWNGTQGEIATQVSSSGKAAVKSAAAASGIALWPSFTDGMPARRLAWLMGRPTKKAKLIDKMVTLAKTEGYAGLDLDFEKFAFSDGSSTWPTTRPLWVLFVKDLSAALHAAGKKLAVTTPPLCSMSGACGGRNGYWVYDWAGIAPYADRLRVMAYDYSWSAPGPIGPYPWTEAIVKYAVTQVPSGKVQIGVPTYGRDWVARKANGGYVASSGCSSSILHSRSTFDAVTVRSRLAAVKLTQADVQWDDTEKESYFSYRKTYSSSCTVTRVAWYGDARAVAARATLVAKYHIAGIATWTIGGEDPTQWSVLRAYAAGIAPAPAGARASAPATVAYGQRARIALTTQSKGLPVVGAAAVLEWRSASGGPWIRLGSATTSAAGTASWAPIVTATGTYRVRIAGTWDRTDASALAAVSVRPLVRAAATAVPLASGGRTRIKARVTPYLGQRVVVQKRSHGAWHRYATARVGRAHNAKATVGKGRYRFVSQTGSRTARSVSAVITVR